MTQRQAKVESLIQQQAAEALARLLPAHKANVTETGVDAAPDLKNATVWLGILALGPDSTEQIMKEVIGVRSQVQEEVAGKMATKFVSRLHLKHDTGTEYAQHIDEVLREL